MVLVDGGVEIERGRSVAGKRWSASSSSDHSSEEFSSSSSLVGVIDIGGVSAAFYLRSLPAPNPNPNLGVDPDCFPVEKAPTCRRKTERSASSPSSLSSANSKLLLFIMLLIWSSFRCKLIVFYTYSLCYLLLPQSEGISIALSDNSSIQISEIGNSAPFGNDSTSATLIWCVFISSGSITLSISEH